MAEFGQNIRGIVSRGMEVIGNTASSIASGTKQKMMILGISSRKKELFGLIGEKVYEAWKRSEQIPAGIEEEITELQELDRQLESMEYKKTDPKEPDAAADPLQDTPISPSEAASSAEKQDSEAAADHEKQPDAGKLEIPYIHVEESAFSGDGEDQNPLSAAINAIFEQMPPVEKMADKVNASLDQMGEQLKQFSSDLGKQISDMADELLGKPDRKDE